MKQLFLLLSLILLSATIASAQNAREMAVKFTKGQQQNAILADYDAPPSTVEQALRERLDKLLGSSHSEKGFITYKAVNWPEISPDKLDVYIKVDGRGNKSTITLLISKGYDNFVSTATDADKVQKAEVFLNGFGSTIAAYQLRQSIAAQEEAVRKAEHSLSNANDDGARLLRDKEKIEKKLAENSNERDKLQNVLSEERRKLEDLKAQTTK